MKVCFLIILSAVAIALVSAADPVEPDPQVKVAFENLRMNNIVQFEFCWF